MEFTNRQLSILSQIIHHPEGITGSELAKQMGISVRTIQMEIKWINENLEKEQQQIVSRARHGYVAEGFSDKAIDEIFRLMESKHTRNMPMDRSNTIISVLLFEKDYLSMEKLAERIYVSKSAIFKEFENSKILKKYVTISRQKGLIISRPESEKRNMLVKCFDKDTAYFYDPNLKEEYEKLDLLFKTILPEIFLAYDYPVSGEAMRSFRRHLIITIFRKEKGFDIEKIELSEEYSPLLLEIVKRIHMLTGIVFSPDDMADCQIKLNGLNIVVKEGREQQSLLLPEYRGGLEKFFEELRSTFGVNLDFSEDEKKQFLLYIKKMDERSRGGHINSNFLKREIHRRYPMSVHLILECFSHCFSNEVPEPEVSNLALYLAAKADRESYYPECVIISDKNPSLLQHLKRQIEDRYGCLLNEVTIIQDYCYTKDPAFYSDKIILTTSETVALHLPDAVFIKPFLTEKYHHDIAEKLERKIEEIKSRMFYQCLDEYGGRVPHICKKPVKDMKEFLRFTGEEKPDCPYEFVLDVNAVLFPEIHYDDTPNRIRIYLLKYPFMYRNTSVHMVVFSDYQAAAMEIKKFYGCLRMILNAEYIRNLEKEYLIT